MAEGVPHRGEDLGEKGFGQGVFPDGLKDDLAPEILFPFLRIEDGGVFRDRREGGVKRLFKPGGIAIEVERAQDLGIDFPD